MNSQSAIRFFFSISERSAANIACHCVSPEDFAGVGAMRDGAERAHEVARRELIGEASGARGDRALALRRYGGGGAERAGRLSVVPSRSVSATMRGPLLGRGLATYSLTSSSGSASGLSSLGLRTCSVCSDLHRVHDRRQWCATSDGRGRGLRAGAGGGWAPMWAPPPQAERSGAAACMRETLGSRVVMGGAGGTSDVASA